MTSTPPFYCIAHQDCPWPLPDFMTVIGTGGYVPAKGIAMSVSYPELAFRNRYLGEYVALFAIRAMLLAAKASGFVGLCHYRRYALVQPLGRLQGLNHLAHPDQLQTLRAEDFYGTGDTPIIAASFEFQRSVLEQYAGDGIGRDLMLFFGDAVDCGIITSHEAAAFLSGRSFIVAPTVAFIPVEWFVEIVHALEVVTSRFYRYHYVQREGYQERGMAFCCERLQALLLAKRAAAWNGPVHARPLTVFSDDAPKA